MLATSPKSTNLAVCLQETNKVYLLFLLTNKDASWTTRVSRYQKGKTNLDFTEARDSE